MLFASFIACAAISPHLRLAVKEIKLVQYVVELNGGEDCAAVDVVVSRTGEIGGDNVREECPKVIIGFTPEQWTDMESYIKYLNTRATQ